MLGDEEARTLLLGKRAPWERWAPMLDPRHERCGAYWLPAGSHTWDGDVPTWVPEIGVATIADAWDAQDALLLPLRGADGSLLGIVAVDEPLERPPPGRRPAAGADGSRRPHRAGGREDSRRGRDPGRAAGRGPPGGRPVARRDARPARRRHRRPLTHRRRAGPAHRRRSRALRRTASRPSRPPASCTTSARSPCRTRSCTSRAPSTTPNGSRSAATRRSARGSSSTPGCTTSPAGCMRTTSGWTGTATPTGSPATRSRSKPASSPSPTPTRRWSSDRPYRSGMPEVDARAELERCAGTQFDPEVVAAFLSAGTLGAEPATSVREALRLDLMFDARP